MEPQELCMALLRAETEEDVEIILETNGYLNDNLDNWRPLGDDENNWGTVGNQHSHATGALVEKIINAVDAVLIRGCWEKGIDPESDDSPLTMSDAARDLFDVRSGRLDSILPAERTVLAENIQFVATGMKTKPNYLVIDKGEGQTPKQFSETFLSLRGKNKYGIPFVQGINNCGGSAVLRFCGDKKFQLLISRRHQSCSVAADDETAQMWGFTLVRAMWPETQRRPRPMYVYLAPSGEVPMFKADSILVLPMVSEPKKPLTAYAAGLTHGTCIKLYNYGWTTRSLATTNAREELEKYLYKLTLPVLISETREYKANTLQTALSGQAVNIATHRDGNRGPRVEKDFNQIPLRLSLPDIGELNVAITVYRVKDNKGKPFDTKRIPYGTMFTINGQVHERLRQDFVRDKLSYGYLNKHMLIAVDCTEMDPHAHSALFSTARDRTVEGPIKKEILNEIITHMAKGNSPLRTALRALNARRRQEQLKNTLNDEEPLKVLEGLVRSSPALAAIFNSGERIHNPWMPDDKQPDPFVGVSFPTFFRITGEPDDGLRKNCPINRNCRVQFETDAENGYFNRAESPGDITFTPVEINRSWNLHNGRMSATFMPPSNCRVGDEVEIVVNVIDESIIEPHTCRFKLLVTEPAEKQESGQKQPQQPRGGSKLVMPLPISVTRDGRAIDGISSVKWIDREGFDEFTALQIEPSGEDGQFDIYINMDNIHLHNELRRESRTSEHPLITYYFKYGLLLIAMGMLHENKRNGSGNGHVESNGNPANCEVRDSNDSDYLQEINDACKGIATVIVPVVQRLSASAEKTLATF